MPDSEPTPQAPSPGDPITRSPGALRWLCWLPLVSLFAAEIYVGNFDGWGAWAAAPMLLVPALISFIIVILVLFDCASDRRAGRLRLTRCVYAGIAALPLLWLAVRRFFM